MLSRYIPPYTTIACPTWTLHRDGELFIYLWILITLTRTCAYKASNFKDPNHFKPERWLGATRESPHNMEAFVPFSYGIGVCVGKQLGLQNMKFVLVLVPRAFLFTIVLAYQAFSS